VRWEEVFSVFLVCHLTGDFLVQTEWQALNKRGGLSRRNPEARRALISHVATYTLCFVPALAWLAGDIGAWAIAMAAVIFLPHLILDDCRLLIAWNKRVKGTTPGPGTPVYMAIDQSFHVLTLFATALLAASV
jgi:hypothetical protein